MSKLPPLPGSDEKTLKENKFDNFYQKTPQEIWEGNSIEHIEIKEISKCEHKFIADRQGFHCKKCNIGLKGSGLNLKNNHLYFNNQLVI